MSNMNSVPKSLFPFKNLYLCLIAAGLFPLVNAQAQENTTVSPTPQNQKSAQTQSPQTERAAWADIDDPALQAAITNHQNAVHEIRTEFIKQTDDLENRYQMREELIRARLISSLAEAMEEETKRVNLEEANRIKQAITQLEKSKLKLSLTRDKAAGNQTSDGAERGQTKRKKVRVPKNAIRFAGHDYLILAQPLTWHLANEFAKSQGGHLARIDSAEEMLFIRKLTQNQRAVWVDGSDETEERAWKFSNGQPVDLSLPFYVKFSELNHEHMLTLTPEGLTDACGSNRQPFIIEWEK